MDENEFLKLFLRIMVFIIEIFNNYGGKKHLGTKFKIYDMSMPEGLLGCCGGLT